MLACCDLKKTNKPAVKKRCLILDKKGEVDCANAVWLRDGEVDCVEMLCFELDCCTAAIPTLRFAGNVGEVDCAWAEILGFVRLRKRRKQDQGEVDCADRFGKTAVEVENCTIDLTVCRCFERLAPGKLRFHRGR